MSPAVREWLGIFRNVVYFLGALVLASVVVHMFPALRELEEWMEDRESSLLWLTIPVTMVGVALLLGGIALHFRRFPKSRGTFLLRHLKESPALRAQFPWIAALGATLIFVGVFATCIVVSPIELKLLLGVLALYAIVRTAWAVYRA